MPVAILLHIAPYIAMAVMGLGIWGLFEQHKVDQAKIESAQAQVVQDQKDRAESEKQLGILQGKLENIDARAQPVIQRIVAAPATSGCGPSVAIAIDGVRQLYGQPAAAPRSKPALKAAVLQTYAAYKSQPER